MFQQFIPFSENYPPKVQHSITSYVIYWNTKTKCNTKQGQFFSQNGMTCFEALSLVLSWCGASTQSFIVTPFGFKRAKDSGSTSCISVNVMLGICKMALGSQCKAKTVFACILQIIFNLFNKVSHPLIFPRSKFVALRDGWRYQNGRIFLESSKGGGHFWSKNLCCTF